MPFTLVEIMNSHCQFSWTNSLKAMDCIFILTNLGLTTKAIIMSTKRLILVLFIVSSCMSFGQNQSPIDSLLTAYNQHKEDTLKLKTINNLINYYMYRNTPEVKPYADEMLALALKLKNVKGESLALYQLGVYYYTSFEADSASSYYNQSLEIALADEDVPRISSNYRGLTIIEFSQGNMAAADSIIDLDLANSLIYQDSMGIALAYDFKGTINQNKGYYDIALANVQKGLKYFEALGDSIRIADTYTHLATLESNIGNTQKAIEYNLIALKVYQKKNDVFYQAQALNDIGVMYKILKEYDKALDYLNQAVTISEQAKANEVMISSFTTIGDVYFEQNQLQRSISYYEKSIALGESLNSKRKVALAQNKMAGSYLALRQPNQAMSLAESSLAYSVPNNTISFQRVSQRVKSQAYEQLGNYVKALEHHKNFKVLSDSIINTETSDNIENLRAQFDLEKKEARLTLQEQEIIALDAQAESDKLAKLLYGLGLAAAVIIGLLVIFGLRQRMRKNKIEREKQEAILRQEIEFKKKELASQTLHLVQKSTFIQELKENLEKIKSSPELFKIEFRRLILLLKKERAEDKDWEVFKSYFSEVHNNFDDKIKQINDSITEKEMRLASFLRMRLSTKEIASMLNVLPDSVLKSKYRLKQKLALDKETDLVDFLNTL